MPNIGNRTTRTKSISLIGEENRAQQKYVRAFQNHSKIYLGISKNAKYWLNEAEILPVQKKLLLLRSKKCIFSSFFITF